MLWVQWSPCPWFKAEQFAFVSIVEHRGKLKEISRTNDLETSERWTTLSYPLSDHIEFIKQFRAAHRYLCTSEWSSRWMSEWMGEWSERVVGEWVTSPSPGWTSSMNRTSAVFQPSVLDCNGVSSKLLWIDLIYLYTLKFIARRVVDAVR